MSNPFSENPLTKLTDWNAILAGCCCEMPDCAAVEMEQQSRSHTAAGQFYPPFKKPAGASTVKPTLYATKTEDSAYNRESGSAEYYQGWDENPTIPNEWAETLQVMTFPENGGSTVAVTGNYTEDDDGTHADPVSSGSSSTTLFTPLYGGTPFFPDYEGSSDSSEEVTAAEIEVTETTWRDKSAATLYIKGTLGLTLQGAGGNDYQSDLVWSITYGNGYTGYEMSEPKSADGFIGDATTALATKSWVAGGSSASASVTWPTIGDLEPWPAAEDAWNIGQVSVSATVNGYRYRWTVPTAHTGTWYKIMWDVIEEPNGWNATPPTATRSYVSQDNVWEWTDPASRTSDWHEIAPPSVPGSRRVVNVRVWCYGGPYGSLPNPQGDQITP